MIETLTLRDGLLQAPKRAMQNIRFEGESKSIIDNLMNKNQNTFWKIIKKFKTTFLGLIKLYSDFYSVIIKIKPVRGFVLINFPTKWGEKHLEIHVHAEKNLHSPGHSIFYTMTMEERSSTPKETAVL